MADVNIPQEHRVEKADRGADNNDHAMSFCNKIHDELGWSAPGQKNLEPKFNVKDGLLTHDLQIEDSSSRGLGARLDELSTGDTVVHASGKIGVSMPSGEHLELNGNKDWVLTDANGKEIANNRTARGQLSDGAQADHIVPIVGPGWTTLSYPNGDSVTINKNGVSIERDGKRVDVPIAPMAPTERK